MERRDRSHEIFFRDTVWSRSCPIIKTPAASVYQPPPRTSYIIVSIAPVSYLVDPSFVIAGLSIQKFFFSQSRP